MYRILIGDKIRNAFVISTALILPGRLQRTNLSLGVTFFGLIEPIF